MTMTIDYNYCLFTVHCSLITDHYSLFTNHCSPIAFCLFKNNQKDVENSRIKCTFAAVK